MSGSPDLPQAPGVVELREDVPLKPGAGSTGACAAGPRLITTAFALLSAAITLALLTQIYYGDYEVVPHGAAASSAAACSRAGAAALRAGGRAADAAAAAAICLALVAPHRTSLDASGSVVYWEYQTAHEQPPTVLEWGGVGAGGALVGRPPRLLAALASLHASYGALPWPQVLQPAIDLARMGFEVSPGLAAAAAARGVPGYAAGLRIDPALADYLETMQMNSSDSLAAGGVLRSGAGGGWVAGGWRGWAGGAGGSRAAAALAAAFDGANRTADDAFRRVVSSLQAAAAAGGWPGGVSSALAVADPRGAYIALAAGISQPFGSGWEASPDQPIESPAGAPPGSVWIRDEPTMPLDLAPAIIVEGPVCGTRLVMGAESGAALAQGAAIALAGGGVVEAAEGGRVLVAAGGQLQAEPGRPPPAALGPGGPTAGSPAGSPAGLPAGPLAPLPALNIVQQRADALLSHADSRGGGLGARF